MFQAQEHGISQLEQKENYLSPLKKPVESAAKKKKEPLKKVATKTKSSPVKVNFGSTARVQVYPVQVPFNPDNYADVVEQINNKKGEKVSLT